MRQRVLGVLGGMGALASAAFVGTIYKRNPAPFEQAQPVVWLRSNPTLPDRTRALFEGRREELAAAIGADLEALLAAGADRLVICCITAHAIWPLLPEAARARTVSLLDALFEAPALPERRRLVLCTEATRRLRLLEDHPSFPRFSDMLAFPDDAGQAAIHEIVYELKRGASPAALMPTLAALARAAGATGFVAACTEMHLLTELPEGFDIVDPLNHIADTLETILG